MSSEPEQEITKVQAELDAELERKYSNPIAWLAPTEAIGAATVSATVTVLIGALAIKASTAWFDTYGLALFFGLPFVLGWVSAFLYSLREERSYGSCVSVGLLSTIGVGAAAMVFAMEGIICLIMALPLAVIPLLIGTAVGLAMTHDIRQCKGSSGGRMAGVLLALPLTMSVESRLLPEPPVRKVVTSVDIQAPPEAVWKCVVAFPPIPEPTDLVFRAGIAYPLNATIKGRGVGAIRYCNFSTGPFVEPITTWDEPRKLAFKVTHNPAPMREISWYKNLQPEHLHNFMRSRQGQFRLIRVNANTTRLEGTTWYQHDLWPNWYWGLISDALIHKIHYRVLNHIKHQTENRK